ncbi:MAG: RNA-binding protein [Clostridium sp.]|nr:RNA-binding protein [Clostridium sp.]
MEKKELKKYFVDEELDEVLNLYEKYRLAEEREIPLFGKDFYTPNIWRFFEKNINSGYCKVESCGCFDEAERRMISFNNNYDIPYPYKVIKITNNSKFSNEGHRNFLGSLLALGIKRSKLGDLLVKDNCCYVPVCEEIAEFILSNLKSIGKSPCKVEILTEDFVLPKVEFTETVILVQGLRLDSIVAKLAKVARGKAQNMIEEGKVLVDYICIREKSFQVQSGERITIRGLGKYLLGDVVGNSKSGKFKVIIKKYT